MKRITYVRASALLRYDPKSGHIYWKQSRGRCREGQRAGAISRKRLSSSWAIQINGKKYGYGPIAWLLMTGEYPKRLVDFRNNNSLDTRWANLVLSDVRTKQLHHRPRNRKIAGVDKSKGGWRARLGRIHIGWFSTRAEAVAARRDAVPPR